MQQITQVDQEEYFLQQFSTTCLAQFSYYIESNKEAIIIDPIRESDMYLDILEKRGAALKYIIETHFHADFVSGHVELSKKTGAKIVFGPTAVAGYEIIVAKDQESLPLGLVNIKVIHTPGHTLESSSFLLLDSKNTPKAVFTGDTVFLGDVGRPDLAVKGDLSEIDLANMLFNSIQKLKLLPDDVIIYPGHGAGSACGKSIGVGTSCTVGRQKVNNYALNANLSPEEFVEIVTSNLPTPPQYFFHDVFLNKNGCELIESVLQKSLVPISAETVLKYIKESNNDVIIIDTRDFNVSTENFLVGSYLISLKIQYAIWTANLFTAQKKIIIIADIGKEKEAIVRLARVGFENVVGYVEGGFDALYNEGKREDLNLKEHFGRVCLPDLNNVKNLIEENTEMQIVDVREKGEWESTGIIEGAICISLGKLENNLAEILKIGETKNIGIYCKSGARASIAASILKKHGVKNVVLLGGVLNMIDKNVNLVKNKI